MRRAGRHRLSLDIPDYIHEALKKYTDETGITITKFLIRLIVKNLEIEEKKK